MSVTAGMPTPETTGAILALKGKIKIFKSLISKKSQLEES